MEKEGQHDWRMVSEGRRGQQRLGEGGRDQILKDCACMIRSLGFNLTLIGTEEWYFFLYLNFILPAVELWYALVCILKRTLWVS